MKNIPTATLLKSSVIRNQRIKYAAATSIGSKIMTFIVQIVALPIAVKSLGKENYALYALLAASVGWLYISNIGIGPGLTVEIATASAKNDKKTEMRLFTSAIIPVFLLTICVGIVVSLLLFAIPLTSIFSHQYLQQENIIKSGLVMLLIFTLLQTLFSVSEAAQAGYQEQYILNLWMIGSGFITILGLLIISNYSPTVIGMILAINAPLVTFRLLNSCEFINNRRFLIPRLSEFNWDDSKNLITNGLAFSIAGIMGSYFNHQLPIILVGISLPAQSTTNISIIMALFMIFFGFINMLIIPFWPAISDSIAMKDISWVKRSYNKLIIFSMVYSLVVFLILGFGGQIILQVWFRGMLKPDRVLLLLYGIYFILHAWEYINFMTLVGLNKIRIPSALYAARGLFVVVVCYFFIPVYGEIVVVVSLCLSIIIFTMLPLPYLYKRTLMDFVTLNVSAIVI